MTVKDKFLSWTGRTATFLGTSRKSRIASAGALLLALCAFGAAGVAPLAPDPADLPVRTIVQELAIPALAEQVARLEPIPQTFVSEERVRSGDTLANLFSRLGVVDDDAANFIKSDKVARAVLQIRQGKPVQAQTGANGTLQWLTATLVDGRENGAMNIVITREGSGFKAVQTPASVEKRIEMRTGEIRSSLFAATDAAQIPDTVSMQLVDVFSTNIDFGSDLRRGDRFNVVYETFWQGGEFLRAGRVLAAQFRNGNATYQSVWFDEPGSKQGGGYFAFDGKSLKKAFLKSPLEFSRISSGFSMRVHPISGMWKQHKGVDFAAPIGTPIRAAGDGVVDFVGVQNGYGNVVVLKHWSDYSTAYAHMSRFAPAVRQGSHVHQGDIIGYVGTTGWATGPHLHYEFRVNNAPRDPLSVDVPNAQPLAAAEMQRFRTVADDMSHRFALLSPADQGFKLASR
jgi:murein DD-endopeptidase MepM/ murein hydrolase activator NlpD